MLFLFRVILMAEIKYSNEELLKICKDYQKRNKFSVGFDKMTPKAAETWLSVNGDELCRKLNSGKYIVQPATGFNVAKSDGRYRSLAGLTIIDCIIQKCVCEKLSETCENVFSDFSFAYRPGRSTGDALKAFCTYASSDYFAAKIDIKSFFDSINHEVLEKALYKVLSDRKTVSLLMSFAKMPVIIDGSFTERNEGLLQMLFYPFWMKIKTLSDITIVIRKVLKPLCIKGLRASKNSRNA